MVLLLDSKHDQRGEELDHHIPAADRLYRAVYQQVMKGMREPAKFGSNTARRRYLNNDNYNCTNNIQQLAQSATYCIMPAR